MHEQLQGILSFTHNPLLYSMIVWTKPKTLHVLSYSLYSIQLNSIVLEMEEPFHLIAQIYF
jgi:hypothetical protein